MSKRESKKRGVERGVEKRGEEKRGVEGEGGIRTNVKEVIRPLTIRRVIERKVKCLGLSDFIAMMRIKQINTARVNIQFISK